MNRGRCNNCLNKTAVTVGAICILAGWALPGATANAQKGTQEKKHVSFPTDHRPEIKLSFDKKKLKVGDAVTLAVAVNAASEDTVQFHKPKLWPMAVVTATRKEEKVDRGQLRTTKYYDLVVLEQGALGPVEVDVDVLTTKGVLGTFSRRSSYIPITSRLANEPNAELKPDSPPVDVYYHDYTLLYVAGALLGLAIFALIIWLLARFLQNRQKAAAPPPPPEPPWVIARAALRGLERERTQLQDADAIEDWIDRLSDVVRTYLGGRYGFDGIESTSDEVLEHLRKLRRFRLGVSEVAEVFGRM